MSPTRRALLAAGQLDAAEIEGRRLDFDDCADCEEAFDAVCEGALSVCLLVDFDYRAATVSSIDTVCGTFDSACWRLEASVACQDQCTNQGVYYCKPRLVRCLETSIVYTSVTSLDGERSVYPKHWYYYTARLNLTRPFLCLVSERSWATWRRSDGSIQHTSKTLCVGTIMIRRRHVKN